MKAIYSFIKKHSSTYEIIINTGFQENAIRLTYQVQVWGSSDLAGIPLGHQNEVTFFNKNGEETHEVPQDANSLNISIGWDELQILLDKSESNQ